MKHPERAWYPPSVNLTYNYIVWLLHHLPYLMGGEYPRDPRETGYQDGPGGGKHQVSPHAPFERAVIIGAELMVRLGRCSEGGIDDGLLAQARYSSDMTDKEIAKWYHIALEDVNWRIVRAITYCASGPVRRWDSHYTDQDGVCRPESYGMFCGRR